jgi:hypothetical protein
MLCDGCDQGFHCYCVGLQQVPLEEWHCTFCLEGGAEREADGGRGDAEAAAR